ncbi:SDR family oxidoreductase [Streptomyces torulosus]|uniref:SDR family oxidoreductase n=1 Tax=Streptomyces torulosus TaxID=68276 RepID=UPI00099F1487|nr:SDR family oxidoreductase [Streptomyces torulosus]
MLSSRPTRCRSRAAPRRRVAALEYATQNIRVNAVAPGVTHTPILDNAPADQLEMLAGQVPQDRLGTPQEIANVAAFLLVRRRGGHVTGQIWSSSLSKRLRPGPSGAVWGHPEAVWCGPEVFGIANTVRSVEQLDNKIPVISVNTSRKIRKPEHSQLNQAAASPVV